MAINNTLKDIREERNLIQADLAEAIGSCSQTIGRIERGERNPSLEIAIRLAHYLKVPVEDIFQNGQDAALNRIFLDEILKKLDARERQLIYMRYFKDMTQTEIAVEMGISQVQVSRMEKRILKQLKDQT